MTESEFNQRVDTTFERLEYALDEVDSDLDYEISGGVLTVSFDNGTVMVFSRQPPTRQLWLAARSGGYHFEYDPHLQDWRDTRSGELFRPFVAAQMRAQAGVEFGWKDI
jgi:CyaY protein